MTEPWSRAPLKVSYKTALRRQWPYWNWVIWERVTGPFNDTAIVDEGLTLRRSTAIRKAKQATAYFEEEDLAGWAPPTHR